MAASVAAMGELEYYAAAGPMTDLSALGDVADRCPSAPAEIAAVVQGLVIHPFWAVAYDVEITGERTEDVQIRSAAQMLATILARDPAPLTTAREPGERFAGNCRSFAALTTALLRHQGNVARDLASLNKVETLPWDAWGEVAGDDPPDEAVDRMAAVLARDDRDELAAAYAADPVTATVFNYVRGVTEPVAELA